MVKHDDRQKSKAKRPPSGESQAGKPRPDPGPGPTIPAAEKARLMEKARQVISQTPEVRPEKIAVLKEAVEQCAYTIDPRKLASVLITDLIPLIFRFRK